MITSAFERHMESGEFLKNVKDPFASFVGTSPGLCEAVEKARVLSQLDATVLLHGEPGVGKQLFARAIHEASANAERPLVTLQCGRAAERSSYLQRFECGVPLDLEQARRTLTSKLLEADGSSLFLNDVCSLPLSLQPELLRVLETGQVRGPGLDEPRPVRFRLIAACSRDLRAEVRAGRFRMDLFCRISVTSVHVPALRERREDLPALVAHFAEDVSSAYNLPPKQFARDVLAAFEHYDFPSNVRELKSVVERMILLSEGDRVELSALPPELMREPQSGVREDRAGLVESQPCPGLEAVECEAIRAAIRFRHGNLTYVAKDLRISRSTLYLKMRKYGLEPVLNEVRLNTR